MPLAIEKNKLNCKRNQAQKKIKETKDEGITNTEKLNEYGKTYRTYINHKDMIKT